MKRIVWEKPKVIIGMDIKVVAKILRKKIYGK